MSTELLFRHDAYKMEARARVMGINERGGIILDQTPFYATGGGQPGDAGHIILANDTVISIATTIYDPTDKSNVIHVPAQTEVEKLSGIMIGAEVLARVEPVLRMKRMRIHTALHLLSVVLPYPVTGGAIGDGDGRLDFDIQEAGMDKAELTEKLMQLVLRDAAISESWITDEELDANPGLVKTMSVKPPRGSGRVRLVSIAGIDLQPCGGTHVRNTSEIGHVTVTDIEKKGKENRRVRIALTA